MKLMIRALFLLLALGPWVQAEPHAHGHHDFSDIPRWVQAFEEPGRDAWQKPEQVVAWLALRPGQVVADLGAASGYFTRPLARAVAPGGYALGLEVEPGFFEPLHRLAEKAGVFNVGTWLCAVDDPRLPAASVDLVFICDTLHHLTERPTYYAKLRAALRPGGRVAVVDFFPDRDIPVGPKKSERLSPEQVSGELQAAGFHISSNLDLLPYQYIVVGTLP